MKPLNISEIEIVVEKLQTLTGGRLQEVRSGETWLELQIYKSGEMHPVIFDLNPRCPMLLPLPAPSAWVARRTPVALFINAHIKNRYLKSVQVLVSRGRVVEFLFDNDARIEVRLFPRGQNILVWSGDKKISHNKILDEPPPMPMSEVTGRTLDAICSEFVQEFLQPSLDNQSKNKSHANQHEKVLKKKQVAREKMAVELEAKRTSPLREIGEWLKTHQTLNVPAEWQEHIDLRKTFAENLQKIFAGAKELQHKILRAEERLQIVDAEIATLLQADPNIPLKSATKNKNDENSILHSAGAKGRTVDLASGHRLFIGRSGADNLRILRAASSWDYWLHLKDESGSHAILRRQKNEKIADSTLLEALMNLVKSTYGEKAGERAGEKFAGLVVECRYVKPIKGDRLGRVNYQNERVISFVFYPL